VWRWLSSRPPEQGPRGALFRERRRDVAHGVVASRGLGEGALDDLVGPLELLLVRARGPNAWVRAGSASSSAGRSRSVSSRPDHLSLWWVMVEYGQPNPMPSTAPTPGTSCR